MKDSFFYSICYALWSLPAEKVANCENNEELKKKTKTSL